MTYRAGALRCMAWRIGDDLWLASCVDLSLACQARSLREVRQQLHAQITSYVLEATTIHREHAEVLLGRKAPLKARLAFAFWRCLTTWPRFAAFQRREGVRIVTFHHQPTGWTLPP